MADCQVPGEEVVREVLVAACILSIAGGAMAGVAPSEVTSRDGTRASFLSQAVGSRGAALGGAFTAGVDDASAPYWNPGGLGKVDEFSGILSYASAGGGINISVLSCAIPVGPVVMGVGASYLDFGVANSTDPTGEALGNINLSEWSAQATAALRNPVLPGWLGGTIGMARDYSGTTIPLAGIGLVSPLNDWVSLGFAAIDIGGSGGASLPMRVSGGVTAKPISFLALNVDGYTQAGRGVAYAAGLELFPGRQLQARLGYDGGKRGGYLGGFSGGFGVRGGRFGFDYAFIPYGFAGVSHRASVVFGIPRVTYPTEVESREKMSAHSASDISGLAMQEGQSTGAAESVGYAGAVGLYKKGDFTGAMGMAKGSLSGSPDDWRAWELMGDCQIAMGDRPAAIKSYRNSLDLNPSNIRLKSWLEQLGSGK